MGDTNWARMPKQISETTIDAISKRLGSLVNSQSSGFAIVLHGGEPLLLGPKRLERTLSTLSDGLSPACTLNIQTNGILLTERILDICAKYNASISVSIDGPADVHDRHRVGHRNQPTHHLVIKGLDNLRQHPASDSLFSGVLAVVDPESDPREVYDYLKSLRAPSIDFLYRDGNNSNLPRGKSSLASTEFGDWLARLVDVYLSDNNPCKIRLIDDMIRLVLGGAGHKEGIGLTSYGIIVIDTDGTITKNDTLKSSFDGADRFATQWSVHTHPLEHVVASSEYRNFHALQRPTSPVCLSCPDLHICGGGMPLHRWSNHSGYNNPSVYCADQRQAIAHIRKRVREFIAAA